ncbi:hypothetical protein CEK71_00920 [Methylovulum psychrotolerans]|uniref:Uncharacterized protein n=1 Tax=Methylovulum psychrotolerans TaxID=1704499 RepID=A0A1Z4BU25_9GAMM|nr:hypothetical protein CEK71_00920 [Methylovulum psychrotolerans]
MICRLLLPVPPSMVSPLKSLICRVSLPAPPSRVSTPKPPLKMSLPAPPSRTLLASLPFRVLLRSLPVPLMASVPVNMSFSKFAANVQLMEDLILSVPPLAVSTKVSAVLSTT